MAATNVIKKLIAREIQLYHTIVNTCKTVKKLWQLTLSVFVATGCVGVGLAICPVCADGTTANPLAVHTCNCHFSVLYEHTSTAETHQQEQASFTRSRPYSITQISSDLSYTMRVEDKSSLNSTVKSMDRGSSWNRMGLFY